MATSWKSFSKQGRQRASISSELISSSFGRKNYPELEIKKKDGAGVYDQDRGWIKSRLYSRFIFGQMHHYLSLSSVVHILDINVCI